MIHLIFSAQISKDIEVDRKEVKEAKLDLDFFLEKKDDTWNVTTVTIYKIDGKVRPQKYFCPMHKDVRSWEKIKCPVWDMEM